MKEGFWGATERASLCQSVVGAAYILDCKRELCATTDTLRAALSSRIGHDLSLAPASTNSCDQPAMLDAQAAYWQLAARICGSTAALESHEPRGRLVSDRPRPRLVERAG